MSKETVWNIKIDGSPAKVTCIQKGNRYILYLDDDHLTNVYRLPPKKMRYGMEEEIMIGSERCKFIVWDEIPDLVIGGRMVNRDVVYETARERRRHNMEMMYTVTAIFGVLVLAGVFVYAYLGYITDETLRGWTSMLTAGIWMIGMGLYMRGKWIEQIP